MASRNFDDVQVLGKGIKIIAGAFKGAANASPTTTQGEGFTVAYSTTGTYTLTLADSYTEVLGVFTSMELDAPASALYESCVERSSTSASAITIFTFQDDGDGTATLADLPAGSNNGNWVHFFALVRNTSAGSTA